MITALSSQFLSYSVKYIINNVEEESEAESDTDTEGEEEIESKNGVKTTKLGKNPKNGHPAMSHPSGFVRHNGRPEDVKMKWRLYLVDKCRYRDHWEEITSSTETFLTIRDGLVNFWNSQFDRFNPGIKYEVIMELVN